MARTPILDVNSSLAHRMALECLNDCIANHQHCPKLAANTSLPTRVIDCKNSSRPRLLISKSVPAPYVALSYVWGGPQTYSTTRANIDKYVSKGINPRLIPQTIRDAIDVTKNLNLRYLWVDALCIIQDSDDDKLNEVAKMRHIYRDAYLTIIASSASCANAGFLHTRNLPASYVKHPQLPFHCRDGRVGTIYAFSPDGPAMVYEPMKEPVNTRAWCLQERLLSPRKLVYATDTLEYHCHTALAAVGGAISGKPIGEQLPSVMFERDRAGDSDASGGAAPVSTWTEVDWQSLHQEWRMVVSNYTRRGLSYPEDKLLAFAGVAEEFHLTWGAQAGRYLAGVWEGLLPDDLLWSRTSWVDAETDASPSADSLAPRLTQSHAPSWSWASVDGHVLPDDTDWSDRDNPACQVVQCELALVDARLPYGHVSASLTLRATVIPAPWIVFPDANAGPAKYLSLYLPTDTLRDKLSNVQPALTESSQAEDVVVGAIAETDDAGEVTSTHKLALRKDQLPRNPKDLLALESGLEEDPALLSFRGDISVFFDSSERVPPEQVAVIVVRRYTVDEDPGAKGLLIAGAGNGQHRRIGYWISFVQSRGNEDGPRGSAWFDSEEFGATSREIVLI